MNRKFTLILEVALLIFTLPLAGGSQLLAAAGPPTGTRTSRFVTHNPEEFAKLIAPGVDAKVILNDVGRFTAGPVWSTRDQCLYFSEIPTNTLMKWSPQTGLSVFRRPSDFACGNVFDLEGRLLTSQNSLGRIVMMLPDGSVTPYITEHQTNRFNSPFDMAVKSDGSIWFTDPDFGVARGKPSPQGGNFIYRFDPKTTNTTRLAGPFERPSGICFSPDESILYFSDSGVTNVFHHIHAYQVKGDGSLADGKTLVRVNPGNPGTLRCDEDGRLWTTAANGIHVYKSDGSAVGQIGTALSPAGFCWGGDEGRTMYIVARRYLYSIETKVRWSGWRSAGPARQVPNQPAASVAP